MKKQVISLILAAGLISSYAVGGCASKCTRDFVYEKMEISTSDNIKKNDLFWNNCDNIESNVKVYKK